MHLLCTIGTLYVLAIVGRIVLSYFPLDQGSALASVFSVLYSITEPVLGPIRRVMPNVGPFDLSPLIVILGIQYVLPLILGC